MSDDRCYACNYEGCCRRECFYSCHGPTPKEKDCTRGIHIAEVKRCVLGDPNSAEYWCKWCGVTTDSKGKPMPKEWTIADRYFYQAGPLPEDRYPDSTISVPEGNGKLVAGEIVCDSIEVRGESKCKKHRTYKAIRKPTTSCEACWRLYIQKHP